LATRKANERGLGVSFILAAQTWRQLVVSYGEEQARTIFGLSNNVVVFGGGKDVSFYRELSDLLGTTTHLQAHSTVDHLLGRGGRTWVPQQVPVLEPAELRQLPTGTVLLVADTCPPLVIRPRRCIDGRSGRTVRADQRRARAVARQPRVP
jgi:type IV secretion system protein VirD4